MSSEHQEQPQFRVTWDMLSCLRYLRSAAFNEFVKTRPDYNPEDLLDVWVRCTSLIHRVSLFKRD